MALIGNNSSTRILGRPLSQTSSARPFTLTGWFRWPVAASGVSFFHSALCNQTVGVTYSGLLFYFSYEAPSYATVCDEKDSAGTENYIFNYYGTGNATNPSTGSGVGIVDGGWYFGAVVYNGLSLRSCYTSQLPGGYVADTFLQNSNTNIASTYDTLCIGAVPFLGSDQATSATHIAESAYWSSDLQIADLQRLAQGESPLRVGPRESLISYYPLIGDLKDYGPRGIGLGDVGSSAYNPQFIDHPPVIRPPRSQLFYNAPVTANAANTTFASSPIGANATATQTNNASALFAINNIGVASSATATNVASNSTAINAISAAGTAQATNNATSSASLNAISVSSTGSQTNVSTATVSLSSLGVLGTATQGNNATASVSSFGISASGAVIPIWQAAGAVPVGSTSVSGTATPIWQASGAVQALTLAAPGTGTFGPIGAGTVSLSIIAGTGTASQTQAATTNLPFAISVAGSGSQTNAASGLIAFSTPSTSGFAIAAETATATAHMPSFGVAGTGIETDAAVGLIPIGYNFGAVANQSMSASGIVALSVSVNGIAKVPLFSTSSIAIPGISANGSCFSGVNIGVGTINLTPTNVKAFMLPGMQGVIAQTTFFSPNVSTVSV